MKNHSTKEKRARGVNKAIQIIYSSLASHQEWVLKKSSEGKSFHRRCVQDYAEVIKILSELY